MGAWGRMSITPTITGGVTYTPRAYTGLTSVSYILSPFTYTGIAMADLPYISWVLPPTIPTTTPSPNVNTYTLTVTQAFTTLPNPGDPGLATRYSSPASGTFSVTISKAPLTITANDDAKIYGDSDPTFSYISSGLVNGETIASIGATVNFNRNAGADVGSYTITPSISPTPSNYTVSLYTGALAIIAKGITIITTALAANSKSYNGAPDATTNNDVTLSGVVGVDSVSAVVSNATFASSIVGDGISVSANLGITGAQAGNYSATPTTISSLSASITAAPLTVTGLSAVSRPVDGTTTLTTTGTATICGDIFGGDTPSVASVSAAFPSSDVGCYSITGAVTLDGSGNTNYSATADLGTACITGAPEPPKAPIPVRNTEHGNNTLINDRKANAFVADFQTPVAAGAPPRKPASAGTYTAGLKAINASRFIR